MSRPVLVLALLAAGCHSGKATTDLGPADALEDGTVPGPDGAKASIDGPAAERPAASQPGPCAAQSPIKCRRQNADGTCDQAQNAICADGLWLCPPGTSSSAPCADAGTDTAPFFGCPSGCPAGQVCVILDFRGIDPRGRCVSPPPQCRPEAGPPDAGVTCDQCTGFALCNGVAACMGATVATYRCGI
jgi:hypothetical protein